MPQMRIRIEEMEYSPENRSLRILAVDEFHQIVTLEIAPVYPRQMAADLEFVASHPNARVLVEEPVRRDPDLPRVASDVTGTGTKGPSAG